MATTNGTMARVGTRGTARTDGMRVSTTALTDSQMEKLTVRHYCTDYCADVVDGTMAISGGRLVVGARAGRVGTTEITNYC
jgi:hypothetical protein